MFLLAQEVWSMRKEFLSKIQVTKIINPNLQADSNISKIISSKKNLIVIVKVNKTKKKWAIQLEMTLINLIIASRKLCQLLVNICKSNFRCWKKWCQVLFSEEAKIRKSKQFKRITWDLLLSTRAECWFSNNWGIKSTETKSHECVIFQAFKRKLEPARIRTSSRCQQSSGTPKLWECTCSTSCSSSSGSITKRSGALSKLGQLNQMQQINTMTKIGVARMNSRVSAVFSHFARKCRPEYASNGMITTVKTSTATCQLKIIMCPTKMYKRVNKKNKAVLWIQRLFNETTLITRSTLKEFLRRKAENHSLWLGLEAWEILTTPLIFS